MIRQKTIVPVIFFLTCSLSGLYAQSDVLSAGGDATGSTGSVAYSIGQVAYTSIDGEDGRISLGVQQPNLFIMVGTEETLLNISASVFPNPSASTVFLKLEDEEQLSTTKNLSFGLYDLSGKMLLHQDISDPLTTIPMSNLSDAVYLLRITIDNKEIRTFKIFKTN